MIILKLCARRGQCSSSTHNVNGPIFGSASYHYYTLYPSSIEWCVLLISCLVKFSETFITIFFIDSGHYMTALQYSEGSYGERTELRNFHAQGYFCSTHVKITMQILLCIFNKQNDKQNFQQCFFLIICTWAKKIGLRNRPDKKWSICINVR